MNTRNASNTSLCYIYWVPQIILLVSTNSHCDLSVVTQVHSRSRSHDWLKINWYLLVVLENTWRLTCILKIISKALMLLLGCISLSVSFWICHSQMSMILGSAWVQVSWTTSMMRSASARFSHCIRDVLLFHSYSTVVYVLVSDVSSTVRFEETHICWVWNILRVLLDLNRIN